MRADRKRRGGLLVENRSPTAPTPSNSGFSLIEVIVALGILAIGVSTAFALFTAATAAHKRAIDRVHIAAIAEHAIADIESALRRGASPEDIVRDPPFAEIKRNWPQYEVTANFYEIDAETGNDEILLEIKVGWAYRGTRRQESFQQIIAREILIKKSAR